MAELLAIRALCELIVSPQFSKSFADFYEVPPGPTYLAFNPLRLGAAKPAAEFSRYHDAHREVETIFRTRIDDLEDLLERVMEDYVRMDEERERVLKENESMKSMIDSSLYDD